MSSLFRFVMSLAVHMAWQRMGKGAPIPRLRTPKGKTVVLPTLAPWQLMAATWLMNKAWERYGHQVKSRLDNTGNYWVKQAGGLLPTPPSPAPAAATATPPAQPAATPPPVQYDTQVLSSNDPSASPAANNGSLPAGTVLNGLRQA